jgi:serine/threonine protein kinase
MSPEAINLDEPTPMLDIWGLGIVVYELLTGVTPFRGATEMLIYNNISEGKIRFDKNVPPSARKFIELCLKQKPSERIGYDSKNNWIDYSQIRNHEFFRGIDFEHLDPAKVNGFICSSRRISARSFAEMHTERNLKFSHFRPSTANKNSEAFSTMDSVNEPKHASYSSIEKEHEAALNSMNREPGCRTFKILTENYVAHHFDRQGQKYIISIPDQDLQEVPLVFDEKAFLGKNFVLNSFSLFSLIMAHNIKRS